MVRWKFWKKRTQFQIHRARLLEKANESLAVGLNFLESNAHLVFKDVDIYPQFLEFMKDAKRHLDDTTDPKYTEAINSIIKDIENALKYYVQRALVRDQSAMISIKGLTRKIITDITNLQSSISRELRRL